MTTNSVVDFIYKNFIFSSHSESYVKTLFFDDGVDLVLNYKNTNPDEIYCALYVPSSGSMLPAFMTYDINKREIISTVDNGRFGYIMKEYIDFVNDKINSLLPE